MYIGYQNGKITYYTDHIVETADLDSPMVETDEEYVLHPNQTEYIPLSEYEEIKTAYLNAKVLKYRMTKLDFFKYALYPYGITYSQLEEELNKDDMLKATWNLCNHVYRGDATLNQFIYDKVPNITEETLNTLFLTYGEYDPNASY